jgi:hypothetical protein
MNFARRLLENETLQAEIAEINRLSVQHRWSEVNAIVDGALGRELEHAARQFMEDIRQRTTGYQKNPRWQSSSRINANLLLQLK